MNRERNILKQTYGSKKKIRSELWVAKSVFRPWFLLHPNAVSRATLRQGW